MPFDASFEAQAAAGLPWQAKGVTPPVNCHAHALGGPSCGPFRHLDARWCRRVPLTSRLLWGDSSRISCTGNSNGLLLLQGAAGCIAQCEAQAQQEGQQQGWSKCLHGDAVCAGPAVCKDQQGAAPAQV
jgi:hypothetical protein